MTGDAPSGPGSSRARAALFALVAVTSLAAAAGYVAHAMRQRPPPAAPLDAGAAGVSGPRLVFRNLELVPSEGFGAIAVTPLEAPGSARRVTGLRCARIHVAAGKGLCLELDDTDQRRSSVRVLDADLKPGAALPLGGLPSRARVSPDGRYGAVTLFVVGHSYSDGEMSTQTLILDMEGGRVLGDLESFAILRDGAPFDAPDRNLWGVTFARDAGRFYATLASGGKTWLVEGDVAARRVRALRENVECPSLSPDGKRLVFKKRVGGPGAWRLHVLDLATQEERLLAGEERAIDDQVEWLDDDRVLYKHGPNIYELDVDGATPARLFLERGSSPAVVRPPR